MLNIFYNEQYNHEYIRAAVGLDRGDLAASAVCLTEYSSNFQRKVRKRKRENMEKNRGEMMAI